MRDFAAIDFETANREPSSVCSVGLVVVRGGEVVDRFYSLIRPEPKAAPLIGGLPLVAHNSSFDERCLRAVFRTYCMDYPDYTFHCTCIASRRVFGRELPNHQLYTVAARCGFDLTRHHHALADAEACAAIALRIL